MSGPALLEISADAIRNRGSDPLEIRLKDKFDRLYQNKVLDILFKHPKGVPAPNPGFLGGLAVPLQKEDLSTALGRIPQSEATFRDPTISDDLWNYQISPKVDGERFLMFVGSSTEQIGSKNDTLLDIFFIDRNNKPYILRKGLGDKIPTLRKLSRTKKTEKFWLSQNMIPPCLIDGELLAVNAENNIINPRIVDSEDVKDFYFVAFDILLGPDRPRKIEEPGKESIWEYGANVAMCGPKVGGLHGRNWSFIQRSNVLRKILDSNGPFITSYKASCKWFKTLLKPHYSVSDFKKIAEASSRSLKIGLPSQTEFDGVIFTPKWGKYLISHGESRGQVAWIAPNNTVYKWKPNPTVDLLVNESGILYCGSREHPREINKPLLRHNVGLGRTSREMSSMIGGIGEFSFYNNSWHLLKDRSMERDKPNGCKTFENTWNVIENPIRVEDFEVGIRYYKAKPKTQSKANDKISMRNYLNTVMTVQDLVKLAVFSGKISLFSILDISIEEKLALGVDAVRLAPGKITENLYHLLLQKMFWGGFPTEFPPEYLKMGELAGLPPPNPRRIMMKRKTTGSKTTTFWFDGDRLL